nr:CorA family divalent cation transporter [uncultured Dorea sp.]
MRYVLGETLQEYQDEIMEKDRPSIFLATSQTARDCLEQAGMQYEGEINLKDVGFCKIETQQECLAGSLCIPKLLDILGERYRILFFINRQHIVIAQQVRDAYKAQVDSQQNNNMQFLTVISTVFFPLTLITSWYGMNFQNMPELRDGYPGVIILSIVVMITCIIIFKKKKML